MHNRIDAIAPYCTPASFTRPWQAREKRDRPQPGARQRLRAGPPLRIDPITSVATIPLAKTGTAQGMIIGRNEKSAFRSACHSIQPEFRTFAGDSDDDLSVPYTSGGISGLCMQFCGNLGAHGKRHEIPAMAPSRGLLISSCCDYSHSAALMATTPYIVRNQCSLDAPAIWRDDTGRNGDIRHWAGPDQREGVATMTLNLNADETASFGIPLSIRHALLTRIVHAGLAVAIVLQLASSQVMNPDGAGNSVFPLHQFGGLTALGFTAAFCALMAWRRRGTSL